MKNKQLNEENSNKAIEEILTKLENKFEKLLIKTCGISKTNQNVTRK